MSHNYSIIAWDRLQNQFASVSANVCVRLRALSRSLFLIDFHQNWHRRKNPPKDNEFVKGSILHHPIPYFAPKKLPF